MYMYVARLAGMTAWFVTWSPDELPPASVEPLPRLEPDDPPPPLVSGPDPLVSDCSRWRAQVDVGRMSCRLLKTTLLLLSRPE